MYPRRLTLACAFLLTLAGVPACSSPPDAQTRSAATLPAAVVENKYARATEAVRDLFKQAPPPDNPSTLYPTPAVMADFQKSTYLRDQVVRLTLSLSAQDSKSTVLWAQTLPEDIYDVTRHTIQQTAMTAWAEKDPVSATAWAANLPAAIANRRSLMEWATLTWAKTNPSAATHFAFNHSVDLNPDFNVLAVKAAGEWAQKDYAAELAWAETLPPGQTQNNAIFSAVTQMSRTNAPAAWNKALALAKTTHNYDGLSSILSTWCGTDPLAAANALASLPPDMLLPSQLNNAVRLLMRSWMGFGNEKSAAANLAATKWVMNLPPGPLHDEARANLGQMQQISAILQEHGAVAMASTGGTIIASARKPSENTAPGMPILTVSAADIPAQPAPIVVPLRPGSDQGRVQVIIAP